MNLESYYYNCSSEYIDSIDIDIHDEIVATINLLPKRQKQSEINADLFWLLTNKGWYYDTVPQGFSRKPPDEFGLTRSLQEIRAWNNRSLCTTSTTLDTRWHADFAQTFDGQKLVQIEAQYGKVEAMFKDFCGFRIAYAERRLSFYLYCDDIWFLEKVSQSTASKIANLLTHPNKTCILLIKQLNHS